MIDTSSDTNGLLNVFTGMLSKAVDTATDVIALRETGKAVGSVYPTGQVNPDAARTQVLTQARSGSAAPFNYAPFIIGGSALAGLLILVVVLKKL